MKKFCVYCTVYSGNKLPPFYIGSSSVSRIKIKQQFKITDVVIDKILSNKN